MIEPVIFENIHILFPKNGRVDDDGLTLNLYVTLVEVSRVAGCVVVGTSEEDKRDSGEERDSEIVGRFFGVGKNLCFSFTLMIDYYNEADE